MGTLSSWVSPPESGPIHPITGWHSLPPTSLTRCAIPLPCGRDTAEAGHIGLTQLTTEEVRASPVGTYPPVGCVDVAAGGIRPTVHPTVPFGHGVTASFAASQLRAVRSFTRVQPSGPSLRRTRVEAGRIWRLSPGLQTSGHPFACPGREPGHHRACSWFHGSTPPVVLLWATPYTRRPHPGRTMPVLMPTMPNICGFGRSRANVEMCRGPGLGRYCRTLANADGEISGLTSDQWVAGSNFKGAPSPSARAGAPRSWAPRPRSVG